MHAQRRDIVVFDRHNGSHCDCEGDSEIVVISVPKFEIIGFFIINLKLQTTIIGYHLKKT